MWKSNFWPMWKSNFWPISHQQDKIYPFLYWSIDQENLRHTSSSQKWNITPSFSMQSPLSLHVPTHSTHFMVYLWNTGFCQGSFLIYPAGMQDDECSSPPSGIWLHSMQSRNAVWMNRPSSGSLPYRVFIPHSTWLESKQALLLVMLHSC